MRAVLVIAGAILVLWGLVLGGAVLVTQERSWEQWLNVLSGPVTGPLCSLVGGLMLLAMDWTLERLRGLGRPLPPDGAHDLLERLEKAQEAGNTEIVGMSTRRLEALDVALQKRIAGLAGLRQRVRAMLFPPSPPQGDR